MEESDVKLLTTWASPFGMRAALALHCKGVDYETVEEDLMHKSQLLLDSNPVHKKVPVLIHRGKPICESSIIVQYVDQTWPSEEGKDLMPKDPYDRAMALFWGDFIDRKIFYVAARIPTKFLGSRRKAIKQLKKNLAILDTVLGTVAKEKPFFHGSEPGYVDILLAPWLAWQLAFQALGSFKVEFGRELPALEAWKAAMGEVEWVSTAMADPEKLKSFALHMKKVIIKKVLSQTLCPCLPQLKT